MLHYPASGPSPVIIICETFRETIAAFALNILTNYNDTCISAFNNSQMMMMIKFFFFCGCKFMETKPSPFGRITLSSTDVSKSCTCHKFLLSKICLNVIWENKILTKISEFTELLNSLPY